MSVKLDKEPAYILHVKPHLDRTRLVSVFTANHGWLVMVARLSMRFIGAPIEPFTPVRVSSRGSGNLPSIQGYDVLGRAQLRAARAQLLGLYLNELVMKLMAPSVPCAELFNAYVHSLSRIEVDCNDEWALRRFEIAVLEASGRGLNLAHDTEGRAIDDKAKYIYSPEDGAYLSDADETSAAAVEGFVLKCLSGEIRGRDAEARHALAAKRFMRRLVDYYLQGKAIRTRQLFKYLGVSEGERHGAK